jgi:hypothetical protein
MVHLAAAPSCCPGAVWRHTRPAEVEPVEPEVQIRGVGQPASGRIAWRPETSASGRRREESAMRPDSPLGNDSRLPKTSDHSTLLQMATFRQCGLLPGASLSLMERRFTRLIRITGGHGGSRGLSVNAGRQGRIYRWNTGSGLPGQGPTWRRCVR